LIGDKSVGKTCLKQRFFAKKFQDQSIATLGVNQTMKIVNLLDNKKVKLICFDTAGAEQFKSLTTNYYRNADGVLLVYDVTDKATFENALGWMKSIDEFAKENIIRYLVGNKIDLDREVSTKEGQAMADEYNFLFFETSAFSGHNVSDLFENIASEHVTKMMAEGKTKSGNQLA
jgi:small GTP-binding protein